MHRLCRKGPLWICIAFLLLFNANLSISTINDFVDTSSFEQTYPGYVELSFPVPDGCYNPTGLAWDGTNLWLCSEEGWIYEINPDDGSVIDYFSSQGIMLTGLTWDSSSQTLLGIEANSGNIYRIDPDDSSIQLIFSASSYTNLQGITQDSSGAIFFIDKSKGKIVKIDADTYEEIQTITSPSSNLRGLTWDGRYLWASESGEDRIFLVDFDKGLVISSVLSPASEPYGLVYERSETILWHADRTEKRIYRILVRNTDVNYTKDSPFGATVQYIGGVKNNGPDNLSYLKIFFAVPQTSLHQTLLAPVTYDSQHSFDDSLYDIYGQQIAYAKETLGANSSTWPGYETEILNCNLRYFFYPEDVGEESFPQDITDLYINKTFPADQDKYDINDPIIQNAAQEATAGAPNLYWKYRQINDYVVDHLYYNLDDRHDDAPVILQNGHGSCSEYSYLFIALCRAAGLPARYQGGSRPRDEFPYTDEVFHRWTEVYFPDIGWVAVDPTWNDTRTEEPKIIAPYFGLLINKLLVTTTGGGYSSGPDPENGQSEVYLRWNYNCFNSWSPNSNVDIDRSCIWDNPREIMLVEIKITPLNPVVTLERGIEYLKATGYYNDESHEDLTDEVEWASSDIQVGSVSDYDYFSAYELGTTTVTATHQDSGITGSMKVLVTGALPAFRTLTIAAGMGGTVSPTPGEHYHPSGTEINLLAIPDTHYIFTHWSGDVLKGHETDNPLDIILDSDRSLTANFLRLIYAPLNFTGQKVRNRSLLLAEYVNVLSWKANPDNEKIVKYKIYLVNGEGIDLLVELDAATQEYLHRDVERNTQYTYAMVAVNDEGREGQAVYLTIH